MTRIYNRSDRELLVQTDDGVVHRLLAQCVSPRDARPRALWHGDRMWRLEPGFDVHVAEDGADPSIGAGAPRAGATGPRVFGIGVTPGAESPPRSDGAGAWCHRDDELWVTVLGAGVTGLSAAHELATRGFRVQVIERAHGSPAAPGDGASGAARFRRGLAAPDVGGIARTQWATRPVARGADGERPAELEPLRAVHGDAVWFGAGRDGPVELGGYRAFAVAWTAAGIVPFADRLASWLTDDLSRAGRSVAGIQLVVVVYGGDRTAAVARGYARLRDFVASAELAKLPVLDRIEVLPTARIDVAEEEPAEGERSRVGLLVRVHEDLGLIAGEHGFRFFPGFYRHLRDTMRRTPLFDPETRRFTARTALDNLQGVAYQVIADPERPHVTPFARTPLPTIGAVIEQYRILRRDLGYRPSDLVRFALRVLRYTTSCKRRRETDYEHMSWWEFLSKPNLDDPRPEPEVPFGPRFREALLHSPKALVAMGSERADARTQGNLSVQLLMDQFGLHDQSDSALVGPTSSSWLAHWRTYLEALGVRFFLGEVTRIYAGPDERARVDLAFPDRPPADYVDGEAALARGEIQAHYLLSALDLPALARVAAELRRPGEPLAELDRLVATDGRDRDLEDITQLGQGEDRDGRGVGDRFQTLTGIQLYYRRRVAFVDGHIYFAGTPWGLSAIAQVPVWGPFGAGHGGELAGNLSIDIGSWRGDSATANPNTLSRDAIARGVEAQIAACMGPSGRALRRARCYHLDDFIAFGPGGGGAMVPTRNHAPYLINVVSDWHNRPRGEPWSPNDVTWRDRTCGSGRREGRSWFPEPDGYPVHLASLVVAGPHMRTFTRMGTMEAACESARHAVNTILDHATAMLSWPGGPAARASTPPSPTLNVEKTTTPLGDYCDIWDPEVCEFQDLDFLRLVDAELVEAAAKAGAAEGRGDGARAPHMFDILKIDRLADSLDGDGDAIGALESLGAALAALGEARSDEDHGLLGWIERARKAFSRAR